MYYAAVRIYVLYYAAKAAYLAHPSSVVKKNKHKVVHPITLGMFRFS